MGSIALVISTAVVVWYVMHTNAEHKRLEDLSYELSRDSHRALIDTTEDLRRRVDALEATAAGKAVRS